jgi:hypothetical protein
MSLDHYILVLCRHDHGNVSDLDRYILVLCTHDHGNVRDSDHYILAPYRNDHGNVSDLGRYILVPYRNDHGNVSDWDRSRGFHDLLPHFHCSAMQTKDHDLAQSTLDQYGRRHSSGRN